MKTILQEADGLVNNDRNDQYGDHRTAFKVYADIANLICGRDDLDAETVAKVMIAVKLGRQAHKHKRDNLVDLCGYASILNSLEESKASGYAQEVAEPKVTLENHKYAGDIRAWGFTAKEHGWEGNVSDAMSCDVCAIDYGSSDPFYICKWPYSGEAGSLLEYLHNEMEVRDISQPPEPK